MQHALEKCYNRKTAHVYKLYPIFELKYENCTVVRQMNKMLGSKPYGNWKATAGPVGLKNEHSCHDILLSMGGS